MLRKILVYHPLLLPLAVFQVNKFHLVRIMTLYSLLNQYCRHRHRYRSNHRSKYRRQDQKILLKLFWKVLYLPHGMSKAWKVSISYIDIVIILTLLYYLLHTSIQQHYILCVYLCIYVLYTHYLHYTLHYTIISHTHYTIHTIYLYRYGFCRVLRCSQWAQQRDAEAATGIRLGYRTVYD